MPPNFWDIFTIYKSKRNTRFSCAKKNSQRTVRIWRLQGVWVFPEFLRRSSPFQALQLKWLSNLFETSTVPSTDWGFFHENFKTDQLSELWKKKKKNSAVSFWHETAVLDARIPHPYSCRHVCSTKSRIHVPLVSRLYTTKFLYTSDRLFWYDVFPFL